MAARADATFLDQIMLDQTISHYRIIETRGRPNLNLSLITDYAHWPLIPVH
jgi:hypothetical protein